MTYTDAQGRPELVMDPDIARGTAAYRVVAGPTPGTGAAPRPRRDLSPVRAAAADAVARGETPASS